jgi:regulatory protein
VGRDGREQALDRAVSALARRDHSIASLRAKLERAGFTEDDCEDALAALVRDGYVDDLRFAQGRASELARRGYGDAWIRADLDAQGVARETADEALAGVPAERERAVEQAARLGERALAVRTLHRRGFSEDSLEGILVRPLRTTPGEE